MNRCVLFAAGTDYEDAYSNNTICTTKSTKLYVPLKTLSEKDKLKLPILPSKVFENQCTGMNIKQRVRIKIRQMSAHIYSNQSL